MPKVGYFSVDWHFMPNAKDKTKQDAYAQAANYWRMFVPARELKEQAGYETVHSFNFEPAEDGHFRVMDPFGEWHDDCDIVVLQRWMQKDADKATKRARATGQIIIHDVDDHYWAIPKTNMARYFTDPTKFPEFNRDIYLKNLAVADAITVSTPALARRLQSLGPPVFICHNYIDIRPWQVRDPEMPGLVGWVGGLPWRGHDLGILKQGIAEFLKENNLPFYHGGHVNEYGAPTAAEQLGMDFAKVQTRPICEMDGVPNLWYPISVAVIPIEDTPFNRAKSWVKGLEACASGLPFIASKMPEYEALGVGRLVDQRKPSAPQQWVDNLLDLLEPETRRAESARNRERAEELSIQNNWQVWDNVYREFVSSAIAA